MGLLDKIQKRKGEKKKNTEEISAPKSVGPMIETDIDNIYNFVIEKKNVKLSEISSKFNIPITRAEQYAKILDNQGLILLFFPVIGNPRLRIKNYEKEKGSKKKELIKKSKEERKKKKEEKKEEKERKKKRKKKKNNKNKIKKKNG